MSGSATFLTKRVDIEINMFGAVFIDLASVIYSDVIHDHQNYLKDVITNNHLT